MPSFLYRSAICSQVTGSTYWRVRQLPNCTSSGAIAAGLSRVEDIVPESVARARAAQEENNAENE